MQNKTKPLLICFIGIDGAGKTTLATNLMANLRKKDVETTYVWGSHNLVLLRPFVHLMKTKSCIQKKSGVKRNHYRGIRKIIQNPVLAIPYQCFVLIEYLLQLLIKVRIPLLMGKNLVCDRYIYDTVVNLSVNFHYSMKRFKLILRSLLNLCPKPTVIFFVDIPEEIAFSRKNDIPSKRYLQNRRKIYKQLAKEQKMIVVDGTKDVMTLSYLLRNTLQIQLEDLPNKNCLFKIAV